MATRFKDAQDRMLEDLNDDSADMRVRVKQWLNDAKDRIVTYSPRWSWLHDQTLQAVGAAGTWNVTIASIDSTVDALHPIYNRDSDRFIWPLHTSDFYDSSPVPADESQQDPTFFTIDFISGVENVVFNAPFDQTYNLQWRWTKKIPDLSLDADEAPWEEKWDYVWRNGAMFYGLRFNDEDARASEIDFQFLRQRRKMRGQDSSSNLRPNAFGGGARNTKLGIPLYPPRWIHIALASGN